MSSQSTGRMPDCAVCSVYALYGVTGEGAWPKSWPKELEPLRSQARTLVHSQYGVHEIRFTSREQFEAAWPHILAVKSKNAPLTLLGSPNDYRNMGEPIKAGVRYQPIPRLSTSDFGKVIRERVSTLTDSRA